MSRRPDRWFPVRALASLLVGILLAGSASGATDNPARDDLRGLWVDHRDTDRRKVAVWIEDCDGQVCGRIYWLKKSLSASGRPRRDQHNPDLALRDRPLCGLRILTGFRRMSDGTWGGGQIYNPGDGRTFSSTLSLEQDGGLRIRGYYGVSLFGKTVEWVRAQGKLASCR